MGKKIYPIREIQLRLILEEHDDLETKIHIISNYYEYEELKGIIKDDHLIHEFSSMIKILRELPYNHKLTGLPIRERWMYLSLSSYNCATAFYHYIKNKKCFIDRTIKDPYRLSLYKFKNITFPEDAIEEINKKHEFLCFVLRFTDCFDEFIESEKEMENIINNTDGKYAAVVLGPWDRGDYCRSFLISEHASDDIKMELIKRNLI